MITIVSHILFLLLSAVAIAASCLVIGRDGWKFTRRLFGGAESLGRAANKLSLVGLALIESAAALLIVRFGPLPADGMELVEMVSRKFGVFLAILAIFYYLRVGNLIEMSDRRTQ